MNRAPLAPSPADAALARLEAALGRLEAAVARPSPASSALTVLRAEHDSLRAERDMLAQRCETDAAEHAMLARNHRELREKVGAAIADLDAVLNELAD